MWPRGRWADTGNEPGIHGIRAHEVGCVDGELSSSSAILIPALCRGHNIVDDWAARDASDDHRGGPDDGHRPGFHHGKQQCNLRRIFGPPTRVEQSRSCIRSL